MRHFAVSAIGRDRPGIVAAVSEVLLRNSGNIEDSQMTILRGRFTIMLIVSTADDVDQRRLDSDLLEVGRRLALDAVSLNEVSEFEPEDEPQASHILSVYGIDHPGIVHAVTSELAKQGVNVTDLTTRLVGGQESEPIYAMMLEVAVPSETRVAEIEQSLGKACERQGVELTIRPLEQDAL
jgi:glycine cleavage system transcriptional repressor